MHSDSLTEAKQQFINIQNEEKRKKCNITEEEKDDELSDCLKEVRLGYRYLLKVIFSITFWYS